MAESGIYPPINIESSISRSMSRIASPQHLAAAQKFREIVACYLRNRDLITVGAYRAGSDPQLDRAVRLWPRVEAFLRQSTQAAVSFEESIAQLETLLNSEPGDAAFRARG
jgi:flagellum-specific ATP synthase